MTISFIHHIIVPYGRSGFVFVVESENQNKQEGISVKCQPPACQQSGLHSEQVWTCLEGGGGGYCPVRYKLNMSGHWDPVQWGQSWTNFNTSAGGEGWGRGEGGGVSLCGDPLLSDQTGRYEWKHYLCATSLTSIKMLIGHNAIFFINWHVAVVLVFDL